jgi:hypothetical protein
VEWVAFTCGLVFGVSLGLLIAQHLLSPTPPVGANGSYRHVPQACVGTSLDVPGRIIPPRGGPGTAPPSIAGLQAMRRGIEATIDAAKAEKAKRGAG